MKQPVLMIFCILLLSACFAYNRIHSSDKNGLKKMSLSQILKANLLNGKEDLTESSGVKVTTGYLYQEKAQARPMVTLDIKIAKPENELPDSKLIITLDGEDIQLSFHEGKYVIAENLWVPIVHSQNIRYRLYTNHGVLVLSLNEKQKNQLIEFFNKAIKHRDVLFPKIPPGKKKW